MTTDTRDFTRLLSSAIRLSAWKDLRHARLHRLRLPLPLHDRRSRAVVPKPRRAAGRRRPRGYLPHSSTVGTRGRSCHPRSARGCRLTRGWNSTPAGSGASSRPLLFGLGVLCHLLRHGRRYDIVHTASFPYFSLLAAGAAGGRKRFRLLVDWHEVWTREYWREYLGRVGGRIGWRIQRACLRVPQRAFCFSRLHERRLREEGFSRRADAPGRAVRWPARAPEPLPARPVAVFAGRHIPEKRVPTLVPALARARVQIPDLGGEIYGDGPERERVLEAIADCRARGMRHGAGIRRGRVFSSMRWPPLSVSSCLRGARVTA